ncbi:MAG: Fimbrial assembly protein (PilN) [Syntrophorhabdaceae bacterium PtaU1.Bin034]|nr:MAG: Fimbrial assembly protein (PilN) [Syntrophorhabdaceae bacterium PtaU1.Bin034]
MIRVNLLPGKEHEKSHVNLDFYILLAGLIFSLAVVAVVYTKNNKHIQTLQSEMASIKKQTALLQGIQKELLSIEKEKKEISRKIALMDTIKQGRAVAPRFLYDLSSLVKDNVWFKKLRKDEAKFEIEGRSVDNESICDFVDNLAKLPYLKNVELKSVEDITEAGVQAKKFVVEGGVGS